MVAFVAFYRPLGEPTNYFNHPYKYGWFNYIMGILILEIFYVLSEVTESLAAEGSMSCYVVSRVTMF
jgi:hypothetical protein